MQITTLEAKREIIEKVNFFLGRAEELYGVSIDPDVSFDLKGTTAGTAQAGVKPKLRFNLTALQVENGWSHLINNTVPHEVAHLVQYTVEAWPKSRKLNPPHGNYWKRVMRDFGVRADRCHELNLPKARVQSKFDYHCACTDFKISTVTHKRMVRGQKRRCLKCKVILERGKRGDKPRESPYPYV